MPINDRLAAVFEKLFGVEPGGFSTGLTPENVPNWDSIGHMNLVVALENEFGLNLEVDEITEMTSSGKIIELLKAKGVND